MVDDDRTTRMMLSKLIPLLVPCELQACESGLSAIETAAWFLPEVVLLDVALPGMDGVAVARRLRGDERFRRTLLVAVTGYDTPDDRRRICDAGFDLHLPKPIDAEALEQLLHREAARLSESGECEGDGCEIVMETSAARRLSIPDE